MHSLRRLLPLATLAAAIAALYLYNLSGVGLLLPDEPRYTAIGRAMAATGDFLTPRLWGSPWFEKPPLLYWFTAAATLAGLNPELSARLPVALLSLAFLVASFFLLKREFGPVAAAVSAATLATSAGWVAFSQLGLTDLPLAVFFSLAVFLALPLMRRPAQSKPPYLLWLALGVSLGLAALAKGLVPLALALPFGWFLRHYLRQWWLAAAACAAVALPWYVGVYLANGPVFLQEFFLKHHFERLYSAALQHVQPWYYYAPVLLAGAFPWTPLLGLLAVPWRQWDERRRFLLVVCLFGFVLFSLSLNKLPGYLLPLFPSLFALIGAQFETRALHLLARAWLLPCALLISLIPLFTQILPVSLRAGRLSPVVFAAINRTEWFYILVPVIVVFLARRSWRGALLVLTVVASTLFLKARAYPVLDREVSARQMYRQVAPLLPQTCDDWANRDFVYGLSFYAGRLIPPCETNKRPYRLFSHGHGPPTLEPNP